jgi:hypothetical protein
MDMIAHLTLDRRSEVSTEAERSRKLRGQVTSKRLVHAIAWSNAMISGTGTTSEVVHVGSDASSLTILLPSLPEEQTDSSLSAIVRSPVQAIKVGEDP